MPAKVSPLKPLFPAPLLLALMLTGIFLPLSLRAQTPANSVYSYLGEEVKEILPEKVRVYDRLEQTIEVLRDTAGLLTFEQVSAHDEWFVPNNTRGNFDPESVYWMKLNLRADSLFRDSLQFFMGWEAGFRTWEQVDAWLVHEDGSIEQQRTGAALRPEDKTIPTVHSVVAYGLVPGERAHLYVRVERGTPTGRPPLLLGMGIKRAARIPRHIPTAGYQFKGDYSQSNSYTPFRYSIVSSMEVLTEEEEIKDIEALRRKSDSLKWRSYHHVALESGKTHWLKARLIGSPGFQGEHIFHVSPGGNEYYSFDYVDIYTLTNGDALTHQRTGLAVPTHERPYDFWATFFRVKLGTEDTVDLYIRLKGMNRYHPMPFPGLLHIDPISIFEPQVKKAREQMFLLGAIAIQFVFFLALFLVERERIHLYFSLYILGSFLIIPHNDRALWEFVAFPALSSHWLLIGDTGILLTMVGAITFTRTYFSYPATSLFARRVIPAFLWVDICLFIVLQVLPPEKIPGSFFYTAFVGLLPIHILLMTLMGVVARRGPLTFIFFIGITPAFIIGIVRGGAMIMNYLGDPRYLSTVSMEIFTYATLFMLTVFALSIGYRRNLLKREKEEALQASLKAQETLIEKLEETARLEKMDEVKTRFFTNITHEFRTPLTVILGITNQIRGEQEKPKRAEGLDLIERNGKKLLHLINQLLDLSKIDASNLKPQYQAKEVVSFIQYVGESFESLAENKGVRLAIYSEVDTLRMDVDPIMLQKIIANLLSNAIKFTPARGKVVLHLSRQDKRIQIKVKDTGEGIAEEALPHIFDRFYQVDNAASRQGEGTGIGLALVKELVEALEGDIQVKSQVGRGTEFLLTLPIKEAAPLGEEDTHTIPLTPMETVASPVAVPTDSEAESSLPQLLIVEDNPDVVYYLQSVLKDAYQLHIATDGQQGINQAIENIPDLIISDVMMPEKDGFELVEALKTDERTSHIPIILLTAKATQDDKIAGLRHGADAYLMKPFDKEELHIRLENLLEVRRTLQQKYSQGVPTRETATPVSLEEQFLLKVREEIEAKYTEPDFGVDALADQLGMSRVQLYRKLKAICDQSPSAMIRTFRLEKALVLLKNPQLNISEVAYELGYNDPNYFIRQFKQQYGTSPNSYRKSL